MEKKWIQCVWLREEAIFPMMLGTGRAMQDNVVDNNVVVLLIVLSIQEAKEESIHHTDCCQISDVQLLFCSLFITDYLRDMMNVVCVRV